MRAKFPVKAINVKTDIDMLGKFAHYFFRNVFPGVPFKLATFYFFIKIGNHSEVAVLNIVPFVTTIVSYSHLYQLADLWYFRQGIVHDAGMRIIESFISFTQVAVRINLQDSIIRIFFSDGFEIPEGSTMITA